MEIYNKRESGGRGKLGACYHQMAAKVHSHHSHHSSYGSDSGSRSDGDSGSAMVERQSSKGALASGKVQG